MYKKIFFQSIIAAVLCATAGIIYNRIYFFATEADFSRVLDKKKIVALSLAICLLAGMLFWVCVKLLKLRGEVVFNFLFSILSFAGVMLPISMTLPLKIDFPELFPGLAVPMVFFPAMAWYTVRPLFKDTFPGKSV